MDSQVHGIPDPAQGSSETQSLLPEEEDRSVKGLMEETLLILMGQVRLGEGKTRRILCCCSLGQDSLKQ